MFIITHILNVFKIIAFQAPATPIMEGIIDLHNWIWWYLLMILCIVGWMYMYILYNFYIIITYYSNIIATTYKTNYVLLDSAIQLLCVYLCFFTLFKSTGNNGFLKTSGFLKKVFPFELDLAGTSLENFIKNKQLRHKIINELRIYILAYYEKLYYMYILEILITRKIINDTRIEIIWTLIPTCILFCIAIPSFSLLYAMEEAIDPLLTIKCTGYQWFWHYEYYKWENYDVMMISSSCDFFFLDSLFDLFLLNILSDEYDDSICLLSTFRELECIFNDVWFTYMLYCITAHDLMNEIDQILQLYEVSVYAYLEVVNLMELYEFYWYLFGSFLLINDNNIYLHTIYSIKEYVAGIKDVYPFFLDIIIDEDDIREYCNWMWITIFDENFEILEKTPWDDILIIYFVVLFFTYLPTCPVTCSNLIDLLSLVSGLPSATIAHIVNMMILDEYVFVHLDNILQRSFCHESSVIRIHPILTEEQSTKLVLISFLYYDPWLNDIVLHLLIGNKSLDIFQYTYILNELNDNWPNSCAFICIYDIDDIFLDSLNNIDNFIVENICDGCHDAETFIYDRWFCWELGMLFVESYLIDNFNFWIDQMYSEKFISFDSVLIMEDDLPIGYHRLLDVDYPLCIPSGIPIRIMVTSMDVIHSWAVPSFGIKIDAVPGRLSQVNLFVKYEGVFYGQCSELCGVNHGFMPIVVKVI